MKAKLCIGDEPVLEAIADSEEGIGVFDTLKAVAKLVLQDLTRSVDAPAPHLEVKAMETETSMYFGRPTGAMIAGLKEALDRF